MYSEKWSFVDSNGKVCLTQIRHSKNIEQMDSFHTREQGSYDNAEPNVKFPERTHMRIKREVE